MLRRKRTWRTLAAIPLGLALGWIAAGYAAPAGELADDAHVVPPPLEQPGDHRVGDEEPARREGETAAAPREHAEADHLGDDAPPGVVRP